jgi:hypothetical protein
MTWSLIKKNLADFISAIQLYECHTLQQQTVQLDITVDFLLSACQNEACIDDSSSLSNMMLNSVVRIFNILSRWMQSALESRRPAMVYYKEVKLQDI